MSSEEWRKYNLGEIMEIVGGGTPRTSVAEYWNGEIPWISVADFGGKQKYIVKTEKCITRLGLENSSTRILKKGQIIISARGTVGELAILSKDMAFNQTSYGLNAKSITTNEFLYYLLKFNIGQIKRNTHGAVFDTITRDTFDHIEISLPPFPTQRRIAEILSALDDKIELNRQTNATLEAIAQAIFKEWFVDFNFPGATGELVESELGMIPKGWRVGCFEDILNQEIGGDWGKETPRTNSIPVISLRGTDLDQLKISGYAPNAPTRWVKKDSVQKRRIFDTDILIGGSGLGPIGKSIYCDQNLQNMYDLPIIYSNFCKKLRAQTPYQALYAERLLASIYQSGEMKQFFNGTSIPNLDISSLLVYKIILPESGIVEKYFNLIGKSKFCHLFNKENTTLSTLRDTLLPKLMNGEIEV